MIRNWIMKKELNRIYLTNIEMVLTLFHAKTVSEYKCSNVAKCFSIIFLQFYLPETLLHSFVWGITLDSLSRS